MSTHISAHSNAHPMKGADIDRLQAFASFQFWLTIGFLAAATGLAHTRLIGLPWDNHGDDWRALLIPHYLFPIEHIYALWVGWYGHRKLSLGRNSVHRFKHHLTLVIIAEALIFAYEGWSLQRIIETGVAAEWQIWTLLGILPAIVSAVILRMYILTLAERYLHPIENELRSR